MMYQEVAQDLTECPNCKSQIINSEGELICGRCGLVISNQYNYVISPNQNYTFQKEPRYGSIIMNKGSFESISRLQKNISSQNRREKELKWLIDKLCDNFHLSSSIRLDSHKIGLSLLNKFKQNNKKPNKAAIATYSVVTAARFHGLRIAPHYKKIKTYLQNIGFKIKTRDIFQVISVSREIGLIDTKNDLDNAIIEIISMIAKKNYRLEKLKPENRADFINHLRTISFRIFDDLRSKHYRFRGKNPMICIASVIYAASKEAASILKIKNPVTQKELADYIGYAEYSVRETYEELFGKNL